MTLYLPAHQSYPLYLHQSKVHTQYRGKFLRRNSPHSTSALIKKLSLLVEVYGPAQIGI